MTLENVKRQKCYYSQQLVVTVKIKISDTPPSYTTQNLLGNLVKSKPSCTTIQQQQIIDNLYVSGYSN